MGSDSFGRDIYSRVIYGTQVSLIVGIATAAVAMAIGVVLGLLAGFLRGVDGPLMRVMDGLMAIPAILIAIALVAMWKGSLLTVVVAIAIPEIPRVTRLVRSLVLSIREEPYVEAATSLGTPTWKIMLRHILPNTVAPLVVQGTFICGSGILTEAILSFLGVGLPPDIPTWGNVMAEGRAQFNEYPHNIFFPGIFLALTVLAVNILGRRPARHARPEDGEADMTAAAATAVRLGADAERDASAPILEVRNLSIGLPSGGDRSTAVRQVSFDVGRGEILCLVGESGSGKSVIAQSVMGLLPKALPVLGGSIRLQGEELTQAAPARLRALRATRMSMIFQEPMTALNPVMTCGEQISEVLREHTRLGPAERRRRCSTSFARCCCPSPSAWSRAIRTSFPAVSASASSSPWRWCSIRRC
jgi:ABC-type dipeptide/oligopeptide/nickel transport system permease subunit